MSRGAATVATRMVMCMVFMLVGAGVGLFGTVGICLVSVRHGGFLVRFVV
ncbi:hypothetical protein [Paraburkholderia kirstenboschensis]|nr:hypothetical protein [Paraburkholderia kirstenboschensis]